MVKNLGWGFNALSALPQIDNKMRHEEAFTQSEFPAVPESVEADLLRIGGTNDYGEPKLQLVWGQERLWFRAGKWRLKYPVARKLRRLAAWNITHIASGRRFNMPAGPEPALSGEYLVAPVWEDKEIGYEGWILEEWWPPELVCAGWEGQRWFQRTGADGRPEGEKIDLLGEMPVRGDFRFLMYCDDGEEPPTPLEITDHRLMQIVECAFMLRQKQEGSDNWRSVQSPEKAKELQRLIQQDRDKETEADEQEFDNLLTDIISSGYAARMRHAYLS